MRRLVKIAAAASVLGTAFFGPAEAAFIGMPMNLGVQLEHVRFETPTLAPMAHTRSSMEYPDDARPAKSFSGAVASGSLRSVSRI